MSDELTDDEYTVLLIADFGESMMPLGRWEKSVESLVAGGLLKRHDKFNNAITEKGRWAVKARTAQENSGLMTALGETKRVAEHDRLAKQVFDFCKSHPDWDSSNAAEQRAYLKVATDWILQRMERFV